MSAAAAAADAAPDAPKKSGKKKLLIILVALVVLLGGAGAATVVVLKKRAAAAAAAAEEGEEADTHAQAKPEKKAAPVFVPLEVFTVNLADREADRFAQIGITLEVDDAKFGDEIKAFMPAIRNNILLVLAHKTSAELLAREGKQLLAREIRREALRPMGIELPPEPKAEEPSDDEADHGAQAPRAKAGGKKPRKAAPVQEPPLKAVHFSSFIIQ